MELIPLIHSEGSRIVQIQPFYHTALSNSVMGMEEAEAEDFVLPASNRVRTPGESHLVKQRHSPTLRGGLPKER